MNPSSSKRHSIRIETPTQPPLERSFDPGRKKTELRRGPWSYQGNTSWSDTESSNKNMNAFFASSEIKGCASGQLNQLKRIPRSKEAPVRSMFTRALEGIQCDSQKKCPRSREASRNLSAGAGEMKIRGGAATLEGNVKADKGKRKVDKGKGKASEPPTIDLTSDNEAAKCSGHGPEPMMDDLAKDAPLGLTIHRHPPRLDSQDKDEDELLMPLKPKAVGLMRLKGRRDVNPSVSAQGSVEPGLPRPVKTKVSLVSSPSLFQTKRLYLTLQNSQLVGLPWPAACAASHLHFSDQSVHFTGTLPDDFKLTIRSEQIEEIHVDPRRRNQIQFILFLEKTFTFPSAFEDKLKFWSFPLRDTWEGHRKLGFFFELDTDAAGFSEKTSDLLYNSLKKMCKSEKTSWGYSLKKFWVRDCILWKSPKPFNKEHPKVDPRQDLLEPNSSTNPMTTSKAKPTTLTRNIHPPPDPSRPTPTHIRCDEHSVALPSKEFLKSPAGSPAEEPPAAIRPELQKANNSGRTKNETHPVKTSTPNIYSQSVTRSTRGSKTSRPPNQAPAKPAEVDATESIVTVVEGSDSDIVLVWPYDNERSTNSVAITRGDLKRLEEGEFLNDTLIEFGLKWELEKIRQDNQKMFDSIHLFNSFFYQKLSKKQKTKSVLEESKMAYDGVRKWTKKHDLFQKDFVVIPINEHMHWYLMIVVNPGTILELKVLPADASKPRRPPLTRSRTSCGLTPEMDEFADPDDAAPPPDGTASYPSMLDVTETAMASVDRSTEALGQMNLDTEGMPDPESEPPAKEETADVPCVLTLDSLSSAPHRAQGKTVLRYFVNEAHAKRNLELSHAIVDHVAVRRVEVPEQPNFCDCGLYLIHAFKRFFQEPGPMMDWIKSHSTRKQREQYLDWKAEVRKKWCAEEAEGARAAFKKTVVECIPGYEKHVQDAKLKKEQERLSKESRKAKAITEASEVSQSESMNAVGVKRKAASAGTPLKESDLDILARHAASSRPTVVDLADDGPSLECSAEQEPQSTTPSGRSAFPDEEADSPSGKPLSGDCPDLDSVAPARHTKRRRVLEDVNQPIGSQIDTPMSADWSDSERRSRTPPDIMDTLLKNVEGFAAIPSIEESKTPPGPSRTLSFPPFRPASQAPSLARSKLPNFDGEPNGDHKTSRSSQAGPSLYRRRAPYQDINQTARPRKMSELSSPLKSFSSDPSHAPVSGKVQDSIVHISETSSRAHAQDLGPFRFSQPGQLCHRMGLHQLSQPSSSEEPRHKSKKARQRQNIKTQALGVKVIPALSPRIPREQLNGLGGELIDLTDDHVCQQRMFNID